MSAIAAPPHPRAVRTDIQGLRAIAVSLVLAFHVAPESMTGGYVGVDSFFVISGFLITLHLLEKPPGGARDLTRFWARRIRRLLPASLLVLLVSLAGTRLLAPESQWDVAARQVGAAALYIVNWALAGDAVDYLAADDAPSAAQHYWSLSVEEQFYFGWPILILLVLLASRGRRRLVIPALALVVLASFAASVHLTASNPPAAYFVTHTRIWELGVGALLAAAVLMTKLPDLVRRLHLPVPLVVVGLAMLGYAGFAYTTATPFPGWHAAIPVIGTALVIAADADDHRFSPGRLLALRPVQWLGDVSYSVYLWHWPLVVLVPYATGRDLTWFDRGVVLAATLVLAGLTKTWVEDRWRSDRLPDALRHPFRFAAAGMAVVVGAAVLVHVEVEHRRDTAIAEVERALQSDDPCFGARALLEGGDCPPVAYDDLIPSPVLAAEDKSDAYNLQEDGRNCWTYVPTFPTRVCEFGVPDADRSVVLVGNSHAGHWLPTLQRLAEAHRFSITTILASECALADVPQRLNTPRHSRHCLDWVHRTTQDVIDADPDLVVLSNAMSRSAQTAGSSVKAYQGGYQRILQQWADAGLPVLVIRDTPAPRTLIPDCIAEHGEDYAECDGTRADWLRPKPEAVAVRAVADPLVRLLDPTDAVCGPVICRAVNGGVITYFDGSHLTATYATTLAPLLEPEVVRALRQVASTASTTR